MTRHKGIVLVTGSSGLVGSETVRFFSGLGFRCVGVDNDMRCHFFGPEASTEWNRQSLEQEISDFRHHPVDIRHREALDAIFRDIAPDLALVVHCAAQPSHDWAAREPFTDFSINASGTLNLLELTRQHSPEAVFIFVSTNKVYGDLPNDLPLVEQETRWEVSRDHAYFQHGIDEGLSIDQSTHSLFGASKVAADVLTQEYGRYFGLRTGIFRGGCLTGPAHSGTELHGFLAYLARCAVEGRPYTIFGYGGKQVRDNIHSRDLIQAFYQFFLEPRVGEVYNIGGSRYSHCSVREAIAICQRLTGRAMDVGYEEKNRIGDHIWYVSDVRKFQAHYPAWSLTRTVEDILSELCETLEGRP